jgi:RNA polymerase sigma-70 factor (ECF subfamily)
VHDGVGDTDEALVARVARGDREAFARIFSAYAGRVKGYLLRLGAPAAVAEDLAQDAMVAIWRRAASFDPAKAKVSTGIRHRGTRGSTNSAARRLNSHIAR